MKKLLTFLLSLFCISAYAQKITGVVYRAGTDSVITGASVYYNGTMSGTITDKSGRFELPARSRQIPIVVSCIGYDSKTITYKPGQALAVYLEPKIRELHDLTIVANGMDRKDELQLFTDEFIGTSVYANTCTIKNPDDIDLFYSKKTQTLTASCDKPIAIENKSLGYVITYYLHSFTKNPANVVFDGNYTFKEIEDLAKKTKTKSNRAYVYENSRMQFIRYLWHHSLDRSAFQIYDANGHRLTEDSIIVRDSLQQQYVHLKNKVVINFGRSSSFLTANEKYAYINKDGYYGIGLSWGGQMAYQRVGDLLPFEYIPEKELADTLAVISGIAPTGPAKTGNPPTSGTAANYKLFFEKVYLHTDRDLYTAGDTIWYKAYLVNAQNNQPIGTSGNLYVELIQPDSAKIISRQVIRMDFGTGNGDNSIT